MFPDQPQSSLSKNHVQMSFLHCQHLRNNKFYLIKLSQLRIRYKIVALENKLNSVGIAIVGSFWWPTSGRSCCCYIVSFAAHLHSLTIKHTNKILIYIQPRNCNRNFAFGGRIELTKIRGEIQPFFFSHVRVSLCVCVCVCVRFHWVCCHLIPKK